MNDQYTDFKKSGAQTEEMRSNILRGGAITASLLRASILIKETVYTIEEMVSPSRDVIVPFYLPSGVAQLEYVYLNLYFPGLQISDYPLNSPTIYIPVIDKATIEYMDGSWSGFLNEYTPIVSGTGAWSGHYLWYRGFSRFHIASLFGFKLTSCTLRWMLSRINTAGSGANAQLANILDSIDDYEDLDKNDWGAAAQVSYGNVNAYNDEQGLVYSKDVKTRIQALIDAGTAYAAMRFKAATEPTDTANAINYHLSNPLLKCELEEDTDAVVDMYADNGSGFGSKLESYKTNKEDIDLLRFFSGTGKKQLKFSSTKARRINVLLRIGYREQ